MKQETLLRAIDRIKDIKGSAEGNLILGERLDSLHVIIEVSQMDIAGHYEPVPFPLALSGGQIYYDEVDNKSVRLLW